MRKLLNLSFGRKHAALCANIIPSALTVVVDSNQVIREIFWRAGTRRNPDARTDFSELLDAGMIQVYAPKKLCEEVESKIPKLAAKNGIPEDKLWREWENIRARLTIKSVHARRQSRGIRDKNDLPFVDLAAKLEAGILTHDKDIPAMGGKLFPMETLKTLRDYTRAKSAQLGSLVMLTVVFMLFALALNVAFRCAVKNKFAFYAVLFVVVAFAWYLYSDEIRKDRFVARFKSACSGLMGILEECGQVGIESDELWSQVASGLNLSSIH